MMPGVFGNDADREELLLLKNRKHATGQVHMPRSVWVVLCVLVALASPVRADDVSADALNLYGDFRLRLEQDWDSLQGDGSMRDDRLRLRIRLRGGFDYAFSDRWSTTVAARSGPNLSQQSPHITVHDFDGGTDGPYEFNLDHWYLKFKSAGFNAWVGRNELSFWHQDDLFVFDNVTYAGAGGGYNHSAGRGSVNYSLNYVALPVGMRDFVGTGLIGQVAYDRGLGESGYTIAGAFYVTNADPDDPAGNTLLTENNRRDYQILNLQFQYRTRYFGQPAVIGLDLMRNVKNYDDEPTGSFSEFHKDDVDGLLLQLQWGQSKDAGDLLLGYYYVYQEALTTHSSYVQDDWVRWGNANQVRATNLKGSEFRVLYTIRPNVNIFARLFFVDAIDLLEPGDTSRESGNRLRIDFNVAF